MNCMIKTLNKASSAKYARPLLRVTRLFLWLSSLKGSKAKPMSSLRKFQLS